MSESLERRLSAPATQRRTRLVSGAGGGTAIAIIIAFLYQQRTGVEMPSVVAAAIGSLVSTVAICVHDIRDMIWAMILRRRKTDK
jgi:hypothetical protein